METRKVYVSGGSTYVISLPKKWVTRANVKAGDSLMVTEQGNSLLIGTSIIEKKSTTKEIEASKVISAEALKRMIIASYLAGYDTIKVRLDRKDHLPYSESVRGVLEHLIGAQIVEDTNDSMTLEIMVDYQRTMTAQILQRMFSISRSMLLDLCELLESGDARLADDIAARERETDRLYFLVVRQLEGAVRYHQVAEKLGIKNQRDCLGYRIVAKVLERISDHANNIAKSRVQLMEAEGKRLAPRDFSGLIRRTTETFEKSVSALFARDGKIADDVFREIGKIKTLHSDISGRLLHSKNIKSALLQKTMLDSLGRIIGYSDDIAELADDMSVEVP